MDVEHEDHKMKMLRIKTLLKVMFSLSVAAASGWCGVDSYLTIFGCLMNHLIVPPIA